jgi:hypothetical protein
MLNHYPFFDHDDPTRSLTRGDALMARLRDDPRICLYLHGHTHRHIIADVQPSGLPIVLDSGSVAHQGRASWHLIDLDETGCLVTAYRWQEERWQATEPRRLLWNRKERTRLV